MLFNSIEFMIFFPIVVFLYFLFPLKYRYIWLLVASYYFYACWSVEYAFLLLFTTVNTYLCARALKGTRKKAILYGCIIFNLSVLCVCKYSGLIESVLQKLSINSGGIMAGIVLPVGMSFYMFQSLGYLIDVYRGKQEAEKNFVKYALFVSFFPTVVSGPIERSHGLLKQIQNGMEFDYENAKSGMLMIVFGFFEKILIADRLSVIINQIYSDYTEYNGAILAFVISLYAIYIYTDFAGYSYIAVGTSKVLGFHIIENFKQPYFALSIKDFWRRWHISLSGWLKDYVYISLGGNRKGEVRTYLNIILTFLISGIWHGNGLKYIVWGGLHGCYQVVGVLSDRIRKKIRDIFRIKTECFSYRLMQRCITFLLVDFAWLFFGANSFSQALGILKQIVLNFNLGEVLLQKGYLLGLEESRFYLLLVEIVIVLCVDIIHERGKSIGVWLNKQNVVFRWGIYLFIVFSVFVGAIYNYGADTATFLYTQF